MSRVTLDEAIKHCEEVAEENLKEADYHKEWHESYSEKDCRECAEDHRQLAEWLRELRELKALLSKVDIGAAKPKDYLDLLNEWAKMNLSVSYL